jgi:Prolyl oligopeptidase family
MNNRSLDSRLLLVLILLCLVGSSFGAEVSLPVEAFATPPDVTDDRSVRIQHGRKMYRALEKSGKDVTYLEFEDGDHYLSNEVHRLQFFKAMDSFLQSNLK